MSHSILVTGGVGFVGCAIAHALLEKHSDWSLTVLDINVPARKHPDIAHMIADTRNLEEVTKVIATTRPDVVIHTAGVVPPLSSRYGRKDRDKVWRTNVEGTRNVLKASKGAGVKAFVYTSSCCCVTDDMKYHYANVDESCPTSSQSLIYGESKTAAEALVLGASTADFLTCSIRPSVIFGPGDYQVISSLHAMIAKFETPWIIGTGDNMWDVTYVANVADAHVLAAENLLTTQTAAGQAFFVSNNEPIPFRDFCLAVWAYFGHIPPFEVNIPRSIAKFAGFMAEGVTWLTGTPNTLSSGSVMDACSNRYSNGAKAQKILGYEPRIGIEEGLRLSCEAYKNKMEREAAERGKEFGTQNDCTKS